MCRIDGSTSALDRREQVETFQEASDDSPNLFLLSTRAGGMGLNLTAADTVIFYDQDWVYLTILEHFFPSLTNPRIEPTNGFTSSR
jgi:hypothetical protein